MKLTLSQSNTHRMNILNNKYAMEEIEKQVAFPGIPFDDSLRYTKKQLANYYRIDERTIDRYIAQHENEIVNNGYEVLKGKKLNDFKKAYRKHFTQLQDGNDIYVATTDDTINKTSILGVFTFRTFLNMGMLLTESSKAKQLRSLVLDIVIDTINAKIGGSTRYINQREEEFLPSAIRKFNYSKEFTKALNECVADNKWKYAQFTDYVYESIFDEKVNEYRQILQLNRSDSARNTMYSEVLDLIASYENGFAEFLYKQRDRLGRMLTVHEADLMYREFENVHKAAFTPLIEKARSLMASRDMAFRDALHKKLEKYVSPLNEAEYEKFLGEKSMILKQRIKENIDVFKRLNNR